MSDTGKVAVNRAVGWPVRDAVNGSVNGAVRDAVGDAVYWAIHRTVRGALYRAVHSAAWSSSVAVGEPVRVETLDLLRSIR